MLTLEEDRGSPPSTVLSWLTRIGDEHADQSSPPTIMYLRLQCRKCKRFYSSVLYGWEDARFLAGSMLSVLKSSKCPACGSELSPVMLGCVYPAKTREEKKVLVACVSSGESLEVRLVRGPRAENKDLIPKPPTLFEALELSEILSRTLWSL